MTPAEILRAAEVRYQRASRTLEAAQDERDEAVREAHAEGMSTRQIAALVSVSHQRVAQLVKP